MDPQMSKWIRRILLVLQIGGGFTGIAVLVLSGNFCSQAPVSTRMVATVLSLLFSLGIIGGLALAEEKRAGVRLSAIYQLLQVPIVSSPLLTWRLMSGLELSVIWWKHEAVFNGRLGAHAVFTFRRPDPWGIGVNLLPLAIFVYLLWTLRKREETGCNSVHLEHSANRGTDT